MARRTYAPELEPQGLQAFHPLLHGETVALLTCIEGLVPLEDHSRDAGFLYDKICEHACNAELAVTMTVVSLFRSPVARPPTQNLRFRHR